MANVEHVATNEREVGRDRAPLADERAELLADLDRGDVETGSDEIVGEVAPTGTELDDARRWRETERVFAETAQHVTACGKVVADDPRRSGLEGKRSNDRALQIERGVFVRGRVAGATGDPSVEPPGPLPVLARERIVRLVVGNLQLESAR